MIALDTNIIIRFLMADEAEQHAASVRLLKGRAAMFIPDAVVLESVWVLSSLYKVERLAIVGALRDLAALPNVTLEGEARIVQALEWYSAGLDFADALHLAASAGRCSALKTFDTSFIKKAKGISTCKVESPV